MTAAPAPRPDRAAGPPPPPEPDAFGDDRLRLMFTCCHPALGLDARVALTLRTLAGLTTGEIARAFLVEEAAMSKRITRAKRRIRDAGIPYRVPPPDLLPERTTAVPGVLYLLFNEGYGAAGGAELQRRALCGKAIALARLLASLLPGESEARGLLALMLLHDARAAARTDDGGALDGYHLLPATRADLLRRMGRAAEAAAAYRAALDLVANDAERRYLARRLAETDPPRLR